MESAPEEFEVPGVDGRETKKIFADFRRSIESVTYLLVLEYLKSFWLYDL